MKLTHIVSPEDEGLTLHQLLRGPMALSGRETRNVKAQGAVTVDDAPFFSNQKVSAGMIVRVMLNDYDAALQAPSCAAPVSVLYEDDALIAVRKPALVQCHPSPSAPGGSDTLESRVSNYLGMSVHPVHRLDRETTGIVLFARLPYVQAHLQRQMADGSFKKVYRAWVFGVPSPLSGEICAPIRRETPDSFTRIVAEDGQTAISRYTVIQTLLLKEGQAVSLLELSPVTGRTHQLRVHMTHIGCPLLGDTRYFSEASSRLSASLSLSYHQLSAVSLSFIHPITGRPMQLSCHADFSFDPANACASP